MHPLDRIRNGRIRSLTDATGGSAGDVKSPRQGARGTTTHTLYKALFERPRLSFIIAEDGTEMEICTPFPQADRHAHYMVTARPARGFTRRTDRCHHHITHHRKTQHQYFWNVNHNPEERRCGRWHGGYAGRSPHTARFIGGASQ